MTRLGELEGDIKRTVADYLEIGQAQGRWVFLRLNSGNLIVSNPDGSYRRRIRGCPSGTADFIVIRLVILHGTLAYMKPELVVDFIETKSTRGRQTKEQKRFEEEVIKQGCGYHLIRGLDELTAILPTDFS